MRQPHASEISSASSSSSSPRPVPEWLPNLPGKYEFPRFNELENALQHADPELHGRLKSPDVRFKPGSPGVKTEVNVGPGFRYVVLSQDSHSQTLFPKDPRSSDDHPLRFQRQWFHRGEGSPELPSTSNGHARYVPPLEELLKHPAYRKDLTRLHLEGHPQPGTPVKQLPVEPQKAQQLAMTRQPEKLVRSATTGPNEGARLSRASARLADEKAPHTAPQGLMGRS